VEQAWKYWVSNPTNQNIKVLPLILCWGAWLERNNVIFNNNLSTPNCIVAQVVSILSFFPQEKEGPPSRSIGGIQIDKSKP